MGVNAIKGAGALVIFGISWMDHIFSPLIWALMILAGLDIVLNVHKGLQHQMGKIGSAFASLGGLSLLKSGTLFSAQTLHYAVAVMVLVYLQIVVPQIVAFVGNLKFVTIAEKQAASTIIQGGASQLTAEAQKVEQMNMPSPASKQ
ncbi:hypothetical protein [Alicyclobacillus acidoterrestris]|uniref:Uncharacterized protein n=1 Tax=Alicyclobacillus acidoterrestris (strain ATCC 49025 / DSM 3922 / CIP 106132 / NCIMB 13137 / GD3B) TaxID=1356854 RepID=T0BIM0_ALIAG|nr:hypothetical protein [Alicyclobacillus acidoterrestris]EPZ43833.1 hypothetical protein N007_12000 [Alicyclobacillus acidoterrestris ATCC 49025]UNO49035.1 hypothetical protein K1I37_00210 [Alicyclobacillus acidoterrestris]